MTLLVTPYFLYTIVQVLRNHREIVCKNIMYFPRGCVRTLAPSTPLAYSGSLHLTQTAQVPKLFHGAKTLTKFKSISVYGGTTLQTDNRRQTRGFFKGNIRTAQAPFPSLPFPSPSLPVLSPPLPFHPPPFPLPFLPYPFPPLPVPSLPLPLEVGPLLRLRALGERFSSPSGSGRSPAAKRYLVNFKLKILPLVATKLTNFRSFSG